MVIVVAVAVVVVAVKMLGAVVLVATVVLRLAVEVLVLRLAVSRRNTGAPLVEALQIRAAAVVLGGLVAHGAPVSWLPG